MVTFNNLSSRLLTGVNNSNNLEEIMIKQPESMVLKTILEWLNWQGYLAWRNNSGLMFIEGRRLQLAPAGSPDIIGLTKDGRFLGIECKAKGGKQSDNQKMFEEQVKKYHGLYILAYGVQDVELALGKETEND